MTTYGRGQHGGPEFEDGPDPVPPAELLRLRDVLMRGPRSATRARHVAATSVASRQRPLAAPHGGRLAAWGGRVAVGIVASLAITSGLSSAQLLPQPAQRLLTGVSSRFAPAEVAPTTTVTDPADASASSGDTNAPRPDRPAATAVTPTTETTVTSATTAPPTTMPTVDTTIPGPAGPGSPADPGADPEEEPTTTTTSPSTTTTTSPSTTTTTTPSSTTTSPSTTTSTTAPASR